MPDPPPYAIVETLQVGPRTCLRRAIRRADGLAVLLKTLDPRHSGARDIERLKHEYELEKELDCAAVVKPLALDTYEGLPALVMEDFGGESLDRCRGAPMPTEQLLDLAIRVASAVAELHQRDIVHKDLKPDNILVDPATGQVKLADLGLASRIPREHKRPESLTVIEGSLPYMAPEQTGRTNRGIDSRADLYSLGVTFYELLTGRLPFEARDPLEWVHCHVARAPLPPAALVPGVPEALSAVVLKLLAKMAEDRYQTARGLIHDLERCAAEWRTTGRIAPFPLGERDVSGRFQLPERLYDREVEVAQLLSAFERVHATGARELVLVSGISGVGKSALVHELHKPVARERGAFVTGKFDQYKRDIPYVTLVQALHELVRVLLTGSEEQIAGWRQRLVGALAGNGQLIVDMIPQVELVIGRQPPVAELPPAEAQRRFRATFHRFVGAFTGESHPLVLFLDDLQWADVGSLELLHDLMIHGATRHLLVVGAYRDNEVPPEHPLTRTIEAVRREGGRVSTIELGPLRSEHFAALVRDTLHCSPLAAAPLADLVHDKTGGNPLFALQFLTMLHKERLIAFDERAGAFRWDLAKIRGKGFTNNIVDLMLGELARLPASAREAMQLLACLGTSAELAVLAQVYGRSQRDTDAALAEPVRIGLVLRFEGTYKFLHDRVQEAAYRSIPEGERAAVHLRVGKLLASHQTPDELADTIFEVVNQLNRGAALLPSQDERDWAAELNLAAARRARASAAHASALKYLTLGAALLSPDSWDRRYALTFALALGRAECEYLTGDLPAADERLSALLGRARGLVDIAAVTCARVALYTTMDRSDRSIEACLEYLRRVGVEWSPHPTDEEVRQEYGRIWHQLGDRTIESLVDLPRTTDPACRATMEVLHWAQSPALFTDLNLCSLIVGRMANISLEHGNSDASCVAYVFLGMILGSRFGDFHAGYRYGKLGLELLERFGPLRFKARVYVGFGHRISPWTRHTREGLDLLRRAIDAGHEAGDLTYSSYARNCLITRLLAQGEPLTEVQREAESALEFARSVKFGLVIDIITAQERLIRTLRGLTPDLASFNDDEFDESRFERHLEADPRLAIAACWYWIRKLEVRFHAGDFASAVAAAARAQPLLWSSISFFEVAEYHYYHALALAALHGTTARRHPSPDPALVAELRQHEVWADNCPANFADRAALVAAELARIDGDWDAAARSYERAICAARDNGFIHHEAVAYETAARFYRARGFALIADTYLREAIGCYRRWGADGKARALERIYPQLVERGPPPTAAETLTLRAEQLDLLSLIKVSQTISSEIVLDKLARTLLEVVLEQGGAQRACLVLCHGDELSLAAEATLDQRGTATSVFEHAPKDTSRRIPASLVHYVHRTRERVILSDAVADPGRFAGDDYLAQHSPRAILCMPILSRAEVVGILYLENNLVADAFTHELHTALSLLASQAAISLENALLLTKEQAARAAAEAAERRSAFLAEAGELLSASLDYQETLTRLGRLCVRSVAEWCVIDIAEGSEIRRLFGAHVDPAKQPLLAELQRRYPLRRSSRHPASTVLQTGTPVVFPELSDAFIRDSCDDDDHARLILALGARTMIAVPLVARGQTLGVLSLMSTAPGRRYGEADLALAIELSRRAAIAIDNAQLYRETRRAVRVRDEFLSIASHELNTPITALSLSLETIARALSSERPPNRGALVRLVDRALRQTNRLIRLNSEILDASRLQALGLPLARAEVDLGVLTQGVIERLRPELTAAGCPISLQANSAIIGHWDPARLAQLVTSLLTNAIKFGPGRPIEVFLCEEAGTARLAVRDHGLGVDPTRQAQIFDRFERAVPDHHYGGLGLGLYISRKIAEAHGGTIRVQSEPGAGATFTVELPRAGP